MATYTAAIQKLYVAYFNRPADPDGLAFWEGVVTNAGGDTTAVAAAFAATPEYEAEYGDKTNTEVVTQVYQNLFGRAPDSTGLAFWVNALDKNLMTIDLAVTTIAAGAVNADGTPNSDGDIFANKVTAASAFTAAVDTPAEKAGYAGDDALAAAKAFISGIETDAELEAAIAPTALAASVAAVVAAGTPFSLGTAMANLDAAREAKSDLLDDLAEDDVVADELEANGVTGSATDAQILTAIADVLAQEKLDINVELPGYVAASAAMKTAMVADAKAAIATDLTAGEDALEDAQDDIAEVEGLADAIVDYTTAAVAASAANKTAALALTARTAALADLDTLNTGAVTVDGVTGDILVNGDITIEFDAEDGYELATGVTEADVEGVTDALTALNTHFEAAAAATAANTAAAEAFIAADILDSADANVNLTAVAEAFTFIALDDEELPTYAQILTEQEIMADKIAALDAVAGGDAGDYELALDQLAIDFAGAGTLAAAQAFTAAAVTSGYITAADKTAIDAQYNLAGEAAALADNNWLARSNALNQAVTDLLADEAAEMIDADGDLAVDDPSIGALFEAQAAAEADIEAAQTAADDLDDALAAYNAAVALDAAVKAADKAISDAGKVISAEGFATPVVLGTTIALATAKDDLFVASNIGGEIRSMGVLGEDALYVGTTLKYNDAVIGSGAAEVDLDDAGDNAVLEFFLEQDGTDVVVHIESAVYGSESGDTIEIKLVGVDLDDVTVANGFITVA